MFPILNPPPTSLPIPLGHPSAPAPSTLSHASNLDWQSVSYMIIYIFQCHSPKPSHPTPLPPPSPSSSCPRAPTLGCLATFIEFALVNYFTYDNVHISMLFSQIIPALPSPTESKSLLFISVSLLLSCIYGHRYHLSKFHIYALIYCFGVFL